MENNIKGIHHINIQCVGVEHLLKAVDFYKNVLGFKEKRNWKNGEKVVYLLDAGNTSLEISSAGTKPLDNGVITHFALWVEDVDELAEKLKSAGVMLTKEVTESVIKSEPLVPIKVAFLNGPAGEEIELFEERV
jgi:glyoxylase I family protein